MTRLYELANEYAHIQRLAEDGEDVTDALSRIGDAVERKAEAIFAIERGLQSDAQALRDEIARLQRRLRSIDESKCRLREYVTKCMADAGITRVKGPTFTAWLTRHKRVDVVNESAVPAEYKREVVSSCVDKRAIREAYERNGEVVPGAEVVETVSVTIK